MRRHSIVETFIEFTAPKTTLRLRNRFPQQETWKPNDLVEFFSEKNLLVPGKRAQSSLIAFLKLQRFMKLKGVPFG